MKSYFVHYLGKNPDVEKEEMEKSESKSKFVIGACCRYTCMLKLKELENTRKENMKIIQKLLNSNQLILPLGPKVWVEG